MTALEALEETQAVEALVPPRPVKAPPVEALPVQAPPLGALRKESTGFLGVSTNSCLLLLSKQIIAAPSIRAPLWRSV